MALSGLGSLLLLLFLLSASAAASPPPSSCIIAKDLKGGAVLIQYGVQCNGSYPYCTLSCTQLHDLSALDRRRSTTPGAPACVFIRIFPDARFQIYGVDCSAVAHCKASCMEIPPSAISSPVSGHGGCGGYDKSDRIRDIGSGTQFMQELSAAGLFEFIAEKCAGGVLNLTAENGIHMSGNASVPPVGDEL